MPAADDGWALAPWEAVVARLPDPHPFVLPQWQRAWWAHLGGGELAVHVLGEAGVAALRLDADGTARFLGSRDVTDYPGPAVVPGREREAAEHLLRHTRTLDVENARDGFVDHLEAVANELGLHTRRTPDEPVAVLDLPDSWAAYTRSLSRHSRHELERKRRRAAQTALRDGSLDTDLDHFFALFHRAPGEKGAFLEPAIERFMREAAPATGMLRLDVLEADGRPLAITLGFQGPSTYYLYNMVHDRRAHELSPGILLLAALIERAIEEGRERFDFMRGLERYKLELGATPHRLVRLRIAPH